MLVAAGCCELVGQFGAVTEKPQGSADSALGYISFKFF
jgi:hypothetical protein